MNARKVVELLIDVLILAVCYAVFGTFAAARARAALPNHREIRAAFDALDATRNGAISPAEWRTAGEILFKSSDRNHDGAIEQSEIGDNALMREAFPQIDQGHHGRLAQDEFLTLRAAIFRAADIDDNDYLTFVEYELFVLLRRTGWTDRNDDDRIAMSELRQVLGQAFSLLDADHDGVVDGDELEFFAPDHRAAMDPGHTGRISLDELINGYRFLLGADVENRNLTRRAVSFAR